MCEGYCDNDDECSRFAEFDEYLCEYVDGTMDPKVRQVFEEYLMSDPALAEHVEHLRSTRSLLCHYGHQLHAPSGLQARLRQRLGCEVMQSQTPDFSTTLLRLSRVAAVSSVFMLALLAGMIAGGVDLLDDKPYVPAAAVATTRLNRSTDLPASVLHRNAGLSPAVYAGFTQRQAGLFALPTVPRTIPADSLWMTATFAGSLQRFRRVP